MGRLGVLNSHNGYNSLILRYNATTLNGGLKHWRYMKYITHKEYDELWKRLCGSRRITSSDLPSHFMKGMTVEGQSGKGTPFKDEYDRLMHEVNNPKKPLSIRMITGNGEEIIAPK